MRRHALTILAGILAAYAVFVVAIATTAILCAALALHMEQATQPETGANRPDHPRIVLSEQDLAHIATMGLDEICKYAFISFIDCSVIQVGDKLVFKDLDTGPIIRRIRQLLKDMPGLDPLPELEDRPPVSKRETNAWLRNITGTLFMRETMLPSVELPCGNGAAYVTRGVPDISIYNQLNRVINNNAMTQLC